MTRFTDDMFSSNHITTIGVDFKMKKMTIDMGYVPEHPIMQAIDQGIIDREETLKRNVKVQVWDTAGQERYRNITRNFFSKADGILLVYDCGSLETFENVK